MAQLVDMQADEAQARRPRRAAARRPAPVDRPAPFLRSEARRGTDMASRAATRPPRQPAESQERLMTFGLRASITAAMVGMSLFFHAQLGAAVSALLH